MVRGVSLAWQRQHPTIVMAQLQVFHNCTASAHASLCRLTVAERQTSDKKKAPARGVLEPVRIPIKGEQKSVWCWR